MHGFCRETYTVMFYWSTLLILCVDTTSVISFWRASSEKKGPVILFSAILLGGGYLLGTTTNFPHHYGAVNIMIGPAIGTCMPAIGLFEKSAKYALIFLCKTRLIGASGEHPDPPARPVDFSYFPCWKLYPTRPTYRVSQYRCAIDFVFVSCDRKRKERPQFVATVNDFTVD